MNKSVAILFLLLLSAYSAGAEEIFLETESFAEKGGWVVDHEAFPRLGVADIYNEFRFDFLGPEISRTI